MFEQRRWMREGWVPLVAGLAWLWSAASFGVVGFLFSVLPGCLLLSSGVATLVFPGDARIPQFVALGGFLGVPLSVPAFFVGGFWTASALLFSSTASFVAAGAISVRQEPHTAEVPEPLPSLGLALQVAIDDAILASLTLRLPATPGGEHERLLAERQRAHQLFGERGWLENPTAYHRVPPAPIDPLVRPARSRNLAYEHLSFESEYEPDGEEPGRDRWLAQARNRRAHAWVLRHAGGPRPWLVCIHGYEMGWAGIDLPAFRAAQLHRDFGLNLALPVLPLHGPRRIGRQSGEGFLAGDFLDTIHAEAQAMWDIRRLLSWIRAQGETPIGVWGLSLGGYNAALLASLESLACVIAGIPALDFARLTWRHGAPLQIRYAEHHGLVHDEIADILSVVSPLAIRLRVAEEHRLIFAGVADRIVPADQARDLWRHWQRPRIVWYQGGHVTFRLHPEVHAATMNTLRGAGLL
jgi:hypothetical protein